MKKSAAVIVMVLLTASFFPFTGMAQGKIGHLNSDELIRAMPETDSINKILSDLENEYKRLAEQMEVQYNQVYEAYTAQSESMKPLEKKLKESELIDIQKRRQAFVEESQTEYQKRHQELFNPVLQKAQKAIQEVGKENGFQYIIDSAQGILLMLPDDESLNLLTKVKQKLGIR